VPIGSLASFSRAARLVYRLPGELHCDRVVHDPVRDGICDGALPRARPPRAHKQLGRKDEQPLVDPVVEQIEELPRTDRRDRGDALVVEDEEVGLASTWT